MVRELFPFPQFQLPHQSAHHGDLAPEPCPFLLLAVVLIEERFDSGESSNARLLRHSTPVLRFRVALVWKSVSRDLVQALADSRVQVIASIDDHRVQGFPQFSTLGLPSLLLHLGTFPRRFLLARHWHDFVYGFAGFLMLMIVGWFHALPRTQVECEKKRVVIDRSIPVVLVPVYRSLLLIGVDGHSRIVIGWFGDNWLVLSLVVVHLFVIELYLFILSRYICCIYIVKLMI